MRPEIEILREMLPQLSERQWQILRLRVQGHRCKEVGVRLGIDVHTVDTHQRALYRKLRVENVPDMIHLCYACGAVRFPGKTED